jgi:hypothetical protein
MDTTSTTNHRLMEARRRLENDKRLDGLVRAVNRVTQTVRHGSRRQQMWGAPETSRRGPTTRAALRYSVLASSRTKPSSIATATAWLRVVTPIFR